jgi:predicted esterase
MSTIRTAVCATLLFFFSQGSIAERIEVALDDSPALGVYLLLPATANAAPAPLLILMPGGSGEEALARDLQYWLGEEFQQRGWAVAIPVSPNQRSFRGANNALVPQLIDALQQDSRIATGKVLLAGISNGGMSALEIAASKPERFRGIVAVPALVPRGLAVDSLAGMPIYLRIGDQDEMSWMTRLDETAQTLREGGALVDSGLAFMSPHMFQMEWETLDPWLDALGR